MSASDELRPEAFSASEASANDPEAFRLLRFAYEFHNFFMPMIARPQFRSGEGGQLVYRPELDGLRAIAVIAVVLFHCAPLGPFSGGFIGVDLFFVLSGFLITAVLANEYEAAGKINVGRFYWRRFLRLMPALLLFLAMYMVVSPFLWPGYNHARDALLVGAYLSDYSYTFWQLPGYLAHTWSLSVEEHFYLVWPLLLVPLLRSRRPLLWLTAAWAVATLWRIVHVQDFSSYYYRFDTRLSGLMLGCGLHFLAVRGTALIAWASLAALGLILFGANVALAGWWIVLAEIAAAALIVSSANLSFLRDQALVWMGKLSYGIYLWHFPIANELKGHLSFFPTAMLTLALSTGAAAISYYTVESWARRLRSNYHERGKAAVETV